jgi:hypothetical protein
VILYFVLFISFCFYFSRCVCIGYYCKRICMVEEKRGKRESFESYTSVIGLVKLWTQHYLFSRVSRACIIVGLNCSWAFYMTMKWSENYLKGERTERNKSQKGTGQNLYATKHFRKLWSSSQATKNRTFDIWTHTKISTDGQSLLPIPKTFLLPRYARSWESTSPGSIPSDGNNEVNSIER